MSSIVLNWSQMQLDQKEREKRLVMEARQRGMKVRCLDKEYLTLFKTRGYSKSEKCITEHRLVREGDFISCDCKWRQRQPLIMCQHEAVVRYYIKRKRREQRKANAQQYEHI